MGRDCRFRIVEASKDQNGEPIITPKQADNIIKEILDAANKKAGDGDDITDLIAAEIAAKKVNMRVAGDLQRRNAALNLIKERELSTKIDEYVAEGLTVRKALQAVLVGVQGTYKAGRHSVDAKFKAINNRYLGGLANALEKDELMAIIRDTSQQADIERALYSLSKGEEITVKSPQIQKIANIIHDTSEQMRLRQNRAGANISKLDDFTTKQTHNRRRLRKAGYEAWKQKILPLLDGERTFQGGDVDDFLKSTFEVLTTGISRKEQAPEGLFEFKGPQNLAKKVSRSRVLHFKDADSSIAYRQEFGNNNFVEGILQGIERGSRDLALMETLGTNPRAMFEKLRDNSKKKYRSNDEAVKDMSDRVLNNFFDEVDGTTLIPENPTGALVGSVLRGIQTLSKLGGAVLSSVTDIPLKAAELQFQGFDVLESYGIGLSSIRVYGKEKRELGAMLGVGMDGMAGNIAARFTAEDELPGTMSKLQRLFFKFNGLQWWTESQKVGTGLAMSHRLAGFKSKNFDQLDVDTKRIFGNFGIEAKDWDSIRKAASKQVDGREYITPDSIRDLDGLTDKQKEVLEDKLRSYYIDRVDSATLTPDARERAILNQGTRRGTVVGELARFMTQFKSFPVTVLSKTYGRAIYGKGKADVPAMVQTMIMTTLMGYLAMSGKDLAKGKEPRSLADKATWAAAFVQGGGAGIYGDFLFGEYNRFGRSLTSTIAGAVPAGLDDLASIYAAVLSGDDAAAKTVNTLINNMPFANLFYLRPVLNHMFIYQLQESLNPGSIRRMERRVEKENNQKFLIKPSSAL
jgi:hypothetical protein